MGVLLRGASGSGKSDLALRLIDRGARLVADDQVELTERDGELFADAPETIRGLFEVRGVGLVEVPCVRGVRLALVVDLVASDEVPRLPESATVEYGGRAIPALRLSPFESSAGAKVRLAVRAFRRDMMRS